MKFTPRWGRLCVALASVLGAVANAQKPVRIEQATTIRPSGGSVTAQFSPNGRLLATGGETGDLRVMAVETKKVLWTRQLGDHWIGTLAFSPDGSRLACRGRHLTIHDAVTGYEQQYIADAGPESFVWYPDGKRFAYAADRTLLVNDGERASPVARFEYPINEVALGRDDELFVGDSVGRVWRVKAGAGKPVVYRDHRTENDMVRSLGLLFAGNALFDVTSKGPVRRDDTEFAVPGPVFAFACSADGRTFAVGSEVPAVRWWTDGGASFTDFAQPGGIAALAMHPDGKRLFVSTDSGEQRLLERDREPIELPAQSARVSRVALTPDGMTVAVSGKSWQLHPLDGRPPRLLPGARGVSAGRSNGELVVQYAERAVVLDTRSGKEARSVTTKGDHRAALVGPANTLCVGDRLIDASGAVVTELPGGWPRHHWSEVAFADDGRWVCCVGGGLVITDKNGKSPRVVETKPVLSVAFSPDGRHLYYLWDPYGPFGVGSLTRLRIRDAATLQIAHDAEVRFDSWRFLDATRALVSSPEGLQVWDVARLELVQTLPVKGDFALSEDRRTLVVHRPDAVEVYRLTID